MSGMPPEGEGHHRAAILGLTTALLVLVVTRTLDGEALSAFAPGNEPGRLEGYGRLYNWPSALRAYPRGWHLPTDAEWSSLESFLRTNTDIPLRDRDFWPGRAGPPTRDGPGFRARPAGYWNGGGFDTFFGTRAVFWTATAQEDEVAWSRVVRAGEDSLRRAPQHAHYGFSVRCLRDG